MYIHPKLNINEKANKVIKTFTPREKSCYDYIVELIKQDHKHFYDIQIAVRAGDSPQKPMEGYKKVYAMYDRAGYILQTLGLYISIEDNIILITV